MKLGMVWSVAAAEMRSTRRLARTWVFIVVAVLLCAGQWLNLSAAHAFSSYISPAAGLLGPRYLIVGLSALALMIFNIGIVFLAFDVRARDIKDRIGEAIDTRPMSNLSLLAGRLIGIILVTSIAVLAIFAFISFFGWLAETAGWMIGSSIEPTSVISFLLFDIIPNFALWGSLTIFLTVVLRNRLFVVVVVLVLMVGMFYVLTRLPYFVTAALSTSSFNQVFPSDLLPRIFFADVMINRIVMLLLSAGFLVLAAALHPRQEPVGRRPVFLGAGSLVLVLGIAGVLGLYFSESSKLRQVEEWAALHKAHQNASQTDIERIKGTVTLQPGRRIALDLSITIVSNDFGATKDLLFNLNPGYKIRTLTLNGKRLTSNDYQFEGGLLTVAREERSTSTEELQLVADGVPDSSFAYLDSALDFSEMDYSDFENLFFYGQENSIFHSNYFALMPGVSWLPTSGSAYGTTDWEIRPQDFFEVDLEVDVPNGWLVAGPGTRQILDEGERTRFRFIPRIPIPEVALLGSKFAHRSMAVGGTNFELLLSKEHMKNLDVLEPMVPALEQWIEDRLVELRKVGLDYPLETLTLVEVPASLRVYGGGWRMDSVYSPPGIHMLRESGLPTARFENSLRLGREKVVDDDDLAQYLLWIVGTFFENDYHGGNPFISLSKNLVTYQTMPEGAGATALAFVVDEIASRLAFERTRTGYFSIHMAMSRTDSSQAMGAVAGAGFVSGMGEFNWRERFSNLPSVWDSVLAQSLSGIDYHSDPREAYHALLLKGSSIADSVLEGFEEEEVGLFLNELTSRFSGRSYSDQEFFDTALDLGLDFQLLLGDWLHGTGLPGFIVADQSVERLQDTSTGEAVYQTSFILRNDEPVPGVVSVVYEGLWGKKQREMNRMKPIRIDGNTSVRIVFQSDTPVHQVWVDPHLSLNRESLLVNIPPMKDYQPTDSPQLPYVTEVEWKAQDAMAVIVDDLDSGFAVETDDVIEDSAMPGWLGYFLALPDPEYDRGLPTLRSTFAWSLPFPIIGDRFSRWYRDAEPTSYGKYRHTYAVNPSGSSLSTSTFSAQLPSLGRWNLEYHVPNFKREKKEWDYVASNTYGYRRFIDFGNHQIEIQAGNGVKSIEFDVESATEGWNDLGQFDVESPEVAVVITQSDDVGIADAVRWTRAEEPTN